MEEHGLGAHRHHHDESTAVGAGERRTAIVVVISALMMVAELVVGAWTGSMALTADGWHMATHVGALGLALVAYRFARIASSRGHFVFGSGKVYALSGFTSGVLLGAVGIWMAIEGALRLRTPGAVDFGDALPVAVLGLVVNLVCALVLGHGHAPGHADDHGHGHDHAHDHNFRAAYVHILSDALTSVLAIVALVAGRYTGTTWLDPTMGIVGGAVIVVWAARLCRDTGRQLLDVASEPEAEAAVRAALQAEGDAQVSDLHVWSLGKGRRACVVALVTSRPRDVEYYRASILKVADVSHLTVEIHCCTQPHQSSHVAPAHDHDHDHPHHAH